MEAIYREGEDLRRNGAEEDAVIARLEERLQKLTARLDKETAEKLAEIRAAHASAKGFVVAKRYRLPSLIALAAVVAGSCLELTLGKQFVFSAANLRIPSQTGQRFQPNLDSNSKAIWTLIPAQPGQPKVIT
jgi:hypothetical protein